LISFLEAGTFIFISFLLLLGNHSWLSNHLWL
jgi:hypothetical protein